MTLQVPVELQRILDENQKFINENQKAATAAIEGAMHNLVGSGAAVSMGTEELDDDLRQLFNEFGGSTLIQLMTLHFQTIRELKKLNEVLRTTEFPEPTPVPEPPL